MRNARKSKKERAPEAEMPAEAVTAEAVTEAAPEAAVPEAAGEERRAPHERLWEAGQCLYQALQASDADARDQLAAAAQEQQQNLWQVQLAAQKRAEELRQDYWNTLQQATGEDRQRIYQEATQKYWEALQEVQENTRQGWENAGANQQRFVTKLQEVFQMNRLLAFRDYKQACKEVWSELDPDTLSCESLATIGQSLLMSAQFMGGRPYGS
jgi:leucyl aminopeptidase (aminopeptidase T)